MNRALAPALCLLLLGCSDDSPPASPASDVTTTPDTPAPAGDDVAPTPDEGPDGADTADVDPQPELPPPVPELTITPHAVIDFGLVGPGKTSHRKLTLVNTETVDVQISGFSITENTADAEFSIESNLPDTVSPNDYWVIQLAFENREGQAGEKVTGTLRIESDDPSSPTSITLLATRVDTVGCELLLDPTSAVFGVVPYGESETRTLSIVNLGDSPCSWSHATVHDGLEPGSAMPGCSVAAVSTSKHFEVTKSPPAIKDLIKPGDSYPLEITYSPKENALSPSLGETIGHQAVVQVHALDYSHLDASGEPSAVWFPEPAGPQGKVTCNLDGLAGPSPLNATPGAVELAPTPVGCQSKVALDVQNIGASPVGVCEISLVGCPAEVQLIGAPTLPPCGDGGLTLESHESLEVSVTWAPTAASETQCAVSVEASDPEWSIEVPVEAVGVEEKSQAQSFIHQASSKVDVLFVVQSSASMQQKHSLLKLGVASFLAAAEGAGADLHLGVIATAVKLGFPMSAPLNPLGVGPRFVTSSNDTLGSFANMLGVSQPPNSALAGLEAASTALTEPATTQAAPCTDDTSCAAPLVCVPSVLEAGAQYCGGPSMEFLRPDAALEIVFVSDADDLAPWSVQYYLSLFRGLKALPSDVRVHALVGGSGGCPDAEDGARYRELAELTGGTIGSICEASFASFFTALGDGLPPGPHTVFPLAWPVDPPTLTVSVEDQSCEDGWELHGDHQTVVFEHGHSCTPADGQKVTATYDIPCVEP